MISEDIVQGEIDQRLSSLQVSFKMLIISPGPHAPSHVCRVAITFGVNRQRSKSRVKLGLVFCRCLLKALTSQKEATGLRVLLAQERHVS